MALFDMMRQSLRGLGSKASAAAHLYPHGRTAWVQLGAPAWSDRSYHRLAREGYLKNAVAQRSVRLVAECAASVPLKAETNGRRLEEHPLLALLGAPNPTTGGTELLEAVYAYLLLSGNAFLERVDGPEGRPVELHVLRPERMRVIPGPSGWPEAYEFKLGGRTQRFPVDVASGRSPVLHLKSFNPFDDHYGLSALQAAATGIDIHNAASGWNKALLDNAARPSGALVFEPGEGVAGNLTEEQLARLKAEMEEQFQGAANAGRPLLLEGGLKWQQMAFSPADMDFIEAKHVAAREIALAFGVPPMLLGIPGDNTYANYQEANRAFWRLTLLPFVDKVLSGLSRWLGAEHGRAVRLVADRDAIAALAPEREALYGRLNGAGFLTPNEKRAAVGLGPVEGGDTLLPPAPLLPPARGGPRPFDLRGHTLSGCEAKAQAVRAARAARFAELSRALEAARKDGKTVKIWRTQSDGQVRESHRAMEGVRVPIDAAFAVAGERLFLPCDPDGSFEETAGCRCFVEFADAGEGLDTNEAETVEPRPIKRGDNAVLTDEEIANIVFNESASLSGPGIDKARKAIMHAVINGDERFGSRRPGTAPKTINRPLDTLEKNLLAGIQAGVADVRRERQKGIDPTGGNNFFNFRDATDPIFERGEEDVRRQPKRFRNGVEQEVLSSYGPFFNSNPRPEDRMFSADRAFLVILKGKERFVK